MCPKGIVLVFQSLHLWATSIPISPPKKLVNLFFLPPKAYQRQCCQAKHTRLGGILGSVRSTIENEYTLWFEEKYLFFILS